MQEPRIGVLHPQTTAPKTDPVLIFDFTNLKI